MGGLLRGRRVTWDGAAGGWHGRGAPTGCLCRLPSTSYASDRAGRRSGLPPLRLPPLRLLLLLKLDCVRLLGRPC